MKSTTTSARSKTFQIALENAQAALASTVQDINSTKATYAAAVAHAWRVLPGEALPGGVLLDGILAWRVPAAPSMWSPVRRAY